MITPANPMPPRESPPLPILEDLREGEGYGLPNSQQQLTDHDLMSAVQVAQTSGLYTQYTHMSCREDYIESKVEDAVRQYGGNSKTW